MEGCVLLDVGGVWGMNLEWFEGLDGLVSGGKEGEEEALIFAKEEEENCKLYCTLRMLSLWVTKGGGRRS